ncbi:GumC family protein [Azospirillum sp.]|uniref:GumC family protein n=1 Tax=Azospirillum sp. TaxID=34012 RepID=UPI003D762E01
MKTTLTHDLRSLLPHWKLATATFAVLFAASYLLFTSYPATYVAEALVLVDSPRRVIADQAPVIEPKPVDTVLIQTSQAIITSTRFLERVVTAMALEEEPAFVNTGKRRALLTAAEGAANRILDGIDTAAAVFGDTGGPVTERLRLVPPADQIDRPLPTRTERVAAAVEILRRAVTVGQVGRSTVLSIRVSAPDARLGAGIANALADQYAADSTEEQVHAARNAALVIKSRLNELQADLLRSQRAVADFKANAAMSELLAPHGVAAPVILKEIADANTQLMTVQADRLALEARIANLNLRQTGGNTTSALASPGMQRLRDQEAQLAREQAELIGRYGPDHPTIRDNARQMAETRRRIQSEVGVITESLRNELRVVTEKEQLMRANLDVLNGRLNDYQHMQPLLAQLEQEVASNRRMYDTFLERFKQTEEQERLAQPNARVVSAAKAPLRPDFPRLPIVLGASLVGAAAAAVLAAVARSRFRTVIMSADEVTALFGKPEVAIVPELKSGHCYELAAGPELSIKTGRLAAFSEAMANVKFLVFRKPEDRVVLFTSAVPKEGKTFMAVSAALNAAGSGTRTLYVDCDIYKDRNNAITAPLLAGLTECLAGETCWRDSVVPGGDGLPDFLLRGSLGADPARLLSSQTLRRIIEEAREHYDLIVLDGPPILATSSSRFLAAWADSVVFVVRWSKTPRAMALAAFAELAGAGARLSGCVLNRADLRRLRRFGRNGSGAYYGVYRNHAAYGIGAGRMTAARPLAGAE